MSIPTLRNTKADILAAVNKARAAINEPKIQRPQNFTKPELLKEHSRCLSVWAQNKVDRALTEKAPETILPTNNKAAEQKNDNPTQEKKIMPIKKVTSKEICTPIILDGFKNKASKDQIISACFDAGVRSIQELMTLYKTITVEQGLVVDPKKATGLLTAEIEKSDWASVASYSQLEMIVDEIAAAVPGATEQRIKALITAYCNEKEITLPKKEGSISLKSLGGAAVAGMVALFVANKLATKHDCMLVTGPTIKRTAKDPIKSAQDKVNKFYVPLYALANGITLVEANEATKVQTFDAPEPVEEVPPTA